LGLEDGAARMALRAVAARIAVPTVFFELS
jgi:hypothetical protein